MQKEPVQPRAGANSSIGARELHLNDGLVSVICFSFLPLLFYLEEIKYVPEEPFAKTALSQHI